MEIKAVISDIYTTLIDIKTNEKDSTPYKQLASYLKYHGIYLSADELKWFFFEKKALQKRYSDHEYPEVDYRRIWYEILKENQYDYTGPDINNSSIVSDLVKLHRALTTEKIKLYKEVYKTLDSLKGRYRMGIVSDSQIDHAYPELKMLGINRFFDIIIVSAEFGFRKPDIRLFTECLGRLSVKPSESVYIGNDTFRDIKGAKNAGMKTILIMTRHGDKDITIDKPDYIIDRIDEIYDVLNDLSYR
ncbi:HAD family hydrolase [Methanocella sp. CWC-04]|uniref:HAD family hydrolase n=1 Tax=Methanooceanicella nereidis TaxID=2052831 RepID=A0AAP2RB71_9EURY|nr:HAD family hydrolase [Methanocella sp. CWC-04]